MDIEEDRSVLLRVLNPTLHFIGFGIAFEVDDITAVFLCDQNLLDCGVSPFCGLHGAFGAASACALAAPVVGRVDDPIRTEGGGSFSQPVPVQRHAVDTAYHLGSLRVNHPKPGIVRVLDVAIGRRGERNPSVAFHLIDDPALLGNILGVVFIHNVLERGEIVFALVAVHAIGNGHQPHIMEREKFLGELAHLNVVPAQPGEVFHEHRRDISGLDCGNHLLKAGALHGSAGNTVIHEKDSVRVALVLGSLLENFLLVLDAVGLAVHVIVTAQAAVESGCAGRDFLA